jgi:hypothetical protein
MSVRTATGVVCVLDAVAWAFVALAALLSGADAATKGLDQAAGLVVTALFLLTGAPASVLVLLRRAPVTALLLALAFPAALAALFAAAMVAW